MTFNMSMYNHYVSCHTHARRQGLAQVHVGHASVLALGPRVGGCLRERCRTCHLYMLYRKPQRPIITFDSELSIWQIGPQSLGLCTFARHFEVQASPESGVRDPRFESSSFGFKDDWLQPMMCMCVYIYIYIYTHTTDFISSRPPSFSLAAAAMRAEL